MLKEVTISLISVVIGAILGFGLTIGYDTWKELKENKKEDAKLCRKLLEEIRYNIKQAQFMELTGKFTSFRIDEWLNFTGSNVFYELSDDIKRTLDSFYTIIRLNNDGIIKSKKLEEKQKGEMTTAELSPLISPFLEYLIKNKIITISDATLQWIIPKKIENDLKNIASSK